MTKDRPIPPPTAKGQRATKTHHKTGYHKPIKNPTTNYPKDGHKEFCGRCMAYNGGCPAKGDCSL